ncbi:MAG: hypothetical protein OEW18_03915 [Candidatus Aminicenantes bacterium]|nr:hypothetical protein [Candidatus Aminicenantes bacterium]
MTGTELKRNAHRAGAGRGANVWRFFRYNAANVFSGRAVYFMILASAIFLAVVVLNLVSRETAFTSQKIYDLLLIPGVLLVFYPAVFAIQNDKDAGMIETLFGIPDYRYKVWLARYLILYLMVAALLLILAILCRVGLADFPLGRMVLQVMVPVIFLGSLAFFVASQTGSGLGTAVIMVVVILFFWLFRASLEGSSWYLFYNPFTTAGQVRTTVLAKTTIANRLYFISGSLLLTMLALLRLQKREKFI